MKERKEWYNDPFDEQGGVRYHWVDLGSSKMTVDVPKKARRWYDLTPSQATRVSDTIKAIVMIAYTIFIIHLVIGQ